MDRQFFKAGNPRTLLAAFLYFDASFMVWVLLGPLGIAIAHDLHLNAGQKGFLVAIPVLAGALFRVAAGALVDHFGPRRVAILMQLLVIAGLAATWVAAPHTYSGLFPLALVLGVAGASFAVALPLASGWYPPHYQGTALGIAGAGNSGTALAALFAPGLAILYGWLNVVGLATLPLAAVLVAFLFLAKEPPRRPSAGLVAWLPVLKKPDCWALMFFYSVTFGGFVGLASFLTIYFNDQYGLPPAVAGGCTALVVFVGSFVRPLGGALADRIGGDRALFLLYAAAAAVFALIGYGLPTIWLAFPAFFLGMLLLGLGNGAVFQIVPTRFPHQVGILTGLVGMSGGVGGFYLASSLGAARQSTGSYGPGFLAFAGIALLALGCVSVCRRRWKAASAAPLPGDTELPAAL
ncbi:nitrate transporter [Gluconacetobacter sacchari DSM 12717]|uniref:NarK/NasA family nitrate transporter n=2 Tax=Gluconacetobacter sacchari TaxID=92759 RepID=A0A7W4IET6_9PROT|nr:MFS transporter [Gluconacetobacter sacchari]MBB2161432.1 NarK/NasA family nitrate transporter [Gluconacetobacter sacchari]GBQ26146.1 nitrate transporter [Gluconacetobacter sacchari DSM 12717]